jgi:hypothetical protein
MCRAVTLIRMYKYICICMQWVNAQISVSQESTLSSWYCYFGSVGSSSCRFVYPHSYVHLEQIPFSSSFISTFIPTSPSAAHLGIHLHPPSHLSSYLLYYSSRPLLPPLSRVSPSPSSRPISTRELVNPRMSHHLLLARAATPLAHQVAGHQNVMSDESGELVIKVGAVRRGAERNESGVARSGNVTQRKRNGAGAE